MTAEEAAHECIEFILTFGGLEKEEFRLNIAKLRELGYVIIPVTPSGEALDILMATLLKELGRPHDKVALAAYAAIVGGEG